MAITNAEIELDLMDLESALAASESPRVKAFLEKEIERLKSLRTPDLDDESRDDAVDADSKVKEEVAAPAAKVVSPLTPSNPPTNFTGKYVPVAGYDWSQGDYGSDTVSVFIRNLPGVNAVKKNVTCDWTKDSFDLKIHGFNGKNYRLVKENLDKDIVPEECKVVVKKDKVILRLKKLKGEFSYEQWTDLVAKRPKANKSKDPTAGIMDMMKDMYDSGDDSMKKAIGEAMMKSREGKGAGGPGGL